MNSVAGSAGERADKKKSVVNPQAEERVGPISAYNYRAWGLT